MSDANAFKDQGNKAFAAKDWDTAIDLFSQAIAIDPKNHVLWSNRSAAKAGKRDWVGALGDADECIKANPSWAKGYARKGAALHGVRRFDEAIATYEDGLKLEDSPALRKGLQEVKEAKASAEGDNNSSPFSNLFSDPNILGKLAQNPRTAKHLADQAFVSKILFLQKNPKLASDALQDPRMIEVLGVLMGVDMQATAREEGSEDFPQDFKATYRPPSPPTASSSTSPKPNPTPTAAPTEEDVSIEDDDEAQARKAAQVAKQAGADAYRKRDFDEAVRQFGRAWDTWPKDITFLTNLSAAYFEQGDYDKTIETCNQAVDEGRSLRADYKLAAKAYGRAGTAYHRKGDLDNAIKYFNKSLTEHRTADVLTKLKEAEKSKVEGDRLAYVDPEKSAISREEGNKKFKGGDFAGAVKDYTESIKRDPSDPKGYNNRAAAYMKLVAFPEALKDTEGAIKVDPKFVKAYIRKSNVLYVMREYTKALQAIQEAAQQDTENQHTKEIQQQEYKIQQDLFAQRGTESQEETLARAMRDPEIAGIMTDPVMQQILQQAQSDPNALQDHLKNPTVRTKIQKLINAGIIKTR